MNRWLFHQNEFTRTSLSATVTGVSNFAEENVFLLFTLSRLPFPVHSVTYFSTHQLCQSQCIQHVQRIE